MKVFVLLITSFFVSESLACYGTNFRCKQFLEQVYRNTDVQFSNDLSFDQRYGGTTSDGTTATPSGYVIQTTYSNVGDSRMPSRIQIRRGSERRVINFNHDAAGNCSMGNVYDLNSDGSRRVFFHSDQLCDDLIGLANEGVSFEASPGRVGRVLGQNRVPREYLRGSFASEGLRLLSNCRSFAQYQRPVARPAATQETPAASTE